MRKIVNPAMTRMLELIQKDYYRFEEEFKGMHSYTEMETLGLKIKYLK